MTDMELDEQRRYSAYVRACKLAGKTDNEILYLEEWTNAGKPSR